MIEGRIFIDGRPVEVGNPPAALRQCDLLPSTRETRRIEDGVMSRRRWAGAARPAGGKRPVSRIIEVASIPYPVAVDAVSRGEIPTGDVADTDRFGGIPSDWPTRGNVLNDYVR